MELNLLKEIITGSITGYITNAIAVKMIFREYGVGKFKLGGIVKKTRNEFIDNISTLVERDIINDKTLIDELNKDKFKESIEKFIDDLLNVHISKNASDLRLYDIDSLDASINNIETYVKHCFFEYLPNVFNVLYKNVYLKDLLTEKQVNYISKNLIEEVINILEKTEFIENIIEDFYKENKNLSFGDFLGDKLFDIICKNIEKETLSIDLNEEFNSKIDNVLENTIDILQINKVLDKLEVEISEKTLLSFIDKGKERDLSINFKTQIKDFVKSEEGKSIISNFSEELFNILKTTDKPVLELLSIDLQENLNSFFKDKLQFAIKEIILWVEKNKENIEALIEKSIDDTVESMDDGAKKEIINSIKDRFLNDIGTKFNIVGKITEYLNSTADIDFISKDISDKLVKYINEESVGSIVNKLEQNGVFTKEKFSEFINYNIDVYLQNLSDDYFNKLLNKKIKDIYNINLVKLFNNYIKQSLFNTLKNKYIYTEKFTNYIVKNIIKNLDNVKGLKFDEVLSKEQINLGAQAIKKILIDELYNNKEAIRDSVSKKFNINVQDVTLNKPLDENIRKNILTEVVNSSFDKISEVKDIYKDKKIKHLVEKISNIENINSILTENIVLSLKSNLEHILQGNIKNTVSSNLSSLKDEELQTMVEQFMGKEMKPITIIGALLGGIIGFGTYFFNKSTMNFNYYTIILINMVVYGVVGWLTNVQALAMLFKPYTEKRFLGIKIPFTPGVIISRKPRFARSMSVFVDEELLNKESMERLFKKNDKNICSKFKEKFSYKDYKIISDILDKNSSEIINKSCGYIRKLIHNNKIKISQILVNKQKNFNMNKVDFSKVEDKILKELLAKIDESNTVLSSYIINVLKEDKKVLSLIPKEVKTLIEKQLEHKLEKEIDDLLTSEKILSKDNFKSIILGEYENIHEKPIKDLIHPENIDEYKKNLNILLINKISSEETKNKIFSYIKILIEEQVSPNKKIEDLFGGFFVNLIKNNFSYIMDNAVNSIMKGISNKQDVIAEVAITSTKGNLNFFEVIGYNMLGGDEIISTIVDNFINEKLPMFMDEKKVELYETLNDFMDNRISKCSIGELNISIQSENIINMVNTFLSDKENLNIINDNVTKVTDKIVNRVSDIKLQQIMDVLSIRNVEDIIDIFDDEINLFKKLLQNNIDLNKTNLTKEYSKVGYDIFNDLIFSKNVSKFTEGIDEKYIEDMCKSITKKAYENKNINKKCEIFTNDFVTNNIKNKKVEQLFNIEEVNNSTVTIIENLIQNEEVSKVSKNAVTNIIKDMIENKFDILHEDTKEFIANLLIHSMKDALKENFSSIIRSVDFRDITEKEIKNMEPKEIETLFNSFAEKYFNRLKLYGFGGALFGIHWIIGVGTFITYTLSSVKESLKK